MADPGVSGLGSQNATNWTGMTAWTANLTRYAPSMEDLVWACPRMFKRLGSFMAPSDAQSLNESASQLATNSAAVGADLLRTANATFETLMDLGEGGTAGEPPRRRKPPSDGCPSKERVALGEFSAM
uniref:Uncharacterized protein n=1 Tax=Bionectria ochroleuca TaxID=29856 RepID=A0A8H7N6T8_BIOOC